MRKAKNSGIIIFSLIAFLFMAQEAMSYYYYIDYECEGGICIEGHPANWEVTIFNDGKHNIEFTAIELVDAKNHSTFASLKIPYFPQRDDRGDLIPVGINDIKIVNVTGNVPPANSGKNQTYYACFTIAIYDFYTIARDDNYESRQCFSQNETMNVIECLQSSHCPQNQFCAEENQTCSELKCGQCQFIFDHACANFQCCAQDQCSYDFSCMNNTCIKLGCEYNQYAFNHTCYTLDCGYDEQIVNRSCSKLECGFDEFAFNHSCTKLQCREDEFIINHTCRPLNCHEDEAIQDHLCIPLVCADDESISNHSCKKLDCRFFQDAKSHICTNNSSVVTKLILELIALAVLLGLLFMDFGKFEAMHLKAKPDGEKEPGKLSKEPKGSKSAGWKKENSKKENTQEKPSPEDKGKEASEARKEGKKQEKKEEKK